MQSSSLYKSVLKCNSAAMPGSKVPTPSLEQPASPRSGAGGGGGGGVVGRAASKAPTQKPAARACLCAPTTHPGSFRCRMHRLQSSTKPAMSHLDKATPPPHQARKIVVPKAASVAPEPPSETFTFVPIPTPRRQAASSGVSRLSRVSSAASLSDTEEVEEGPMRFLRYAAGAGAAAAVIGAGAMAWKRSHEGHDVQDIMTKPANGGPAAAAAGGLSPGGGRVYEVKKGESLSSISRSLGTTVEILRVSNGLRDDFIAAGQKLWVPKTHEIRKGDTLYKIARDFKTTVGDLLKLNSVADPNHILPGDILLLP